MSKSILDEYIKRRENGSAVYNPRQTPYGQGMSYRQPAAPQMQQPANQSGQVPVYRPNQWSRPAMVQAPTIESELNATPQTDTGGSNVLTWDDQIDIEIQAAAKKVLDVSNRKFQYSPYESPIYSIMRQEYLKEADLAQGRATAAAAQNAGGFGSSFAVMAGEEARRQVMEGFHDQEDELYGAAQAEFEAERASAFDRYLQLRELKEYEKLRTDEATTEMDANTQAATEYLQAAYGTAYSEGAMKNDLLAKGYTEEEANAALEAQRRLAGAVVTDYTASSVSDAISNANTLQQAYANKKLTTEEYDAAVKKNAAVIMDNANAAMANPGDADYAALGITAEEWEGMDEGDRKLEVMDRIGQLVKEGVVPHSDYYKMLYNDLQGEFNSEEYKKSKTQLRDAMDSALVIQDLYDNGYLLQDEYTSLMYNEIYDKIKNEVAIETIDYYDKEWKTMKGEPLSASAFFRKIESGNYQAPGITTTSGGAVKNFSEEEKELLLDMIRAKRKAGDKSTLNKPDKKGAT